MKTLQRNYTTPEQSKRLLEMGVPADSADCYHNEIAGQPFLITYGTLFSDPRHQFSKGTLPCWSVGRLIEITTICREWFDGQKYHSYVFQNNISPLEKAIEKIEIAAKMNQIDFSKLED